MGEARAKVVAVAKTTHKFIVYCHTSLIALNQATDTRYQFKQGQKLIPQFRYIACLVCAFGAFSFLLVSFQGATYVATWESSVAKIGIFHNCAYDAISLLQ